MRLRVTVGGDPSDNEADYETLLDPGEPRALGMRVAGSDVAMLMYTSGTTGPPKGVMLTHDNLMWNAINYLTTGRGIRESRPHCHRRPACFISGRWGCTRFRCFTSAAP